MNRTSYQAVLFDLDGTLVDTAPDMAAALNRLRINHGREALPYEQIRQVVSHGGVALIELAFGDQNAEQKEALRQEFLADYKNNLAEHSTLFDGIEAVLTHLQQQRMPWGIVTNKPGWLSEPLMKQLDLSYGYSSLICGDTLAEKKPHPLPLLTAAEQLSVSAEHCLYVGDAQRDIEAAQNAQMDSVVADYGYIESHENPALWAGTYRINHALELIDLLQRG